MGGDSTSSASSDLIEVVALAAATVACVPAILLTEREPRASRDADREHSIPREPSIDKNTEREINLRRLIHGTDETCLDMFHMKKQSFFRLSAMLKQKKLLKNTLHVSVEEQLAMFLHTIGHNERIRIVGQKFYRSAETVSRYFKHVLAAIGGLRHDLVKPPDSTTPPLISSSDEFMPWFKDCVGVIGNAQIDATVPGEFTERFRGPKGTPAQNILATVTFDLKFSYVLAGWEGSADNTMVLQNALARPNGFQVLEGKFYLVDKGYMTMPGFIAPYQDDRYHPTEFSELAPTDKRELFNLRHSLLQNTAERAIAVLRKRFKILSLPPFLPFETQVDTVLACCIIHNHVMEVDPDDGGFLAKAIQEEENQVYQPRRSREQREQNLEWMSLRDVIASDMWDAYSNMPSQ